MKTGKTLLLFIGIALLVSCTKEQVFQFDSQNEIHFKVQKKGSEKIREINNVELTRVSYSSNQRLPLFNVQDEEVLTDSTYLVANMVYNLPYGLSEGHFEQISITVFRKEALENLVLREPQSDQPLFDYPNQKDIVEKLFPTGVINNKTDLKVSISFTQTYLHTNTMEFNNEEVNFFELTKAVYLEDGNDFGKIQLEGKFDCTTEYIFESDSKDWGFYFSEGHFSAIFDLNN